MTLALAVALEMMAPTRKGVVLNSALAVALAVLAVTLALAVALEMTEPPLHAATEPTSNQHNHCTIYNRRTDTHNAHMHTPYNRHNRHSCGPSSQ